MSSNKQITSTVTDQGKLEIAISNFPWSVTVDVICLFELILSPYKALNSNIYKEPYSLE